MGKHGYEHGGYAVEGRYLLFIDTGQALLGEKASMGLIAAPCVMEAVMARTMPKQWNMGTCIISLSAVERSRQSPMAFPLLTTL